MLVSSVASAQSDRTNTPNRGSSTTKRGGQSGPRLIPQSLDQIRLYNDYQERARKAEERGDFEAAEHLYQLAIALPGCDIPASHLPLARLFDKQGLERQALSQYRIVLYGSKGYWSSTQTDPVILSRYGDLSEKHVSQQEAAKAYILASRQSKRSEGSIEPNSVPRSQRYAAIKAAAHTAAAISLGSHGDFDGRTRELALAVKVDSGYWVPRYYRARDFMDRGLAEEAVREAALAERLAPPEGKEMVRAMRRNNRIPDRHER